MDSLLVIIIGLVFLVIGAGVGFLFGHFVPSASKRRSEELKSELDQKSVEFESYKDEVASHFNETAALVNQLTESYKAVYAHLAKTSYELVDDERLQKIAQLEESTAPTLEHHVNKQEKAEPSKEARQTSPEETFKDEQAADPAEYADPKPDEVDIVVDPDLRVVHTSEPHRPH